MLRPYSRAPGTRAACALDRCRPPFAVLAEEPGREVVFGVLRAGPDPGGARARRAFGVYWLAVGPFSAWIRRMFLRAAVVRVMAAR